MNPQELTTKRYQILKVSAPVSQNALNGLSDTIYVEAKTKRGLVYADPQSLSQVIIHLQYSEPRGIVLPDYILTAIVEDSGSYGFSVIDIELTSNRMFKSLVKELLTSNRKTDLRACFKEIKEPITAIELEYEGFKTKLYGSGLVNVTGPKEEFKYRIKDVLERLTLCLLEALKGVDSNRTAAVSASGLLTGIGSILMAKQES